MAENNPSNTNTLLPAGTQAPEFNLPSTPGKSFSLSVFRGKPLVLAFYPADWSPVCGDQIALYNEMEDEFAEYDAQVLGISVDGVWCHKAFAEARGIRIPLLADFEPKGQVSRQYGAYDEKGGVSQRALFVIDGNGVIRWSYLSPMDVNPGADGIFAALDALGIDKRSGERSIAAGSSSEQRDQWNTGDVTAR